MDIETAELLVALQLEDTKEALKSRKGKEREGEPSDSQIALEEFNSELMRLKLLLSDYRLGCSIGRAVSSDGPLIQSMTQEENLAIRDRQLAFRLGGVPSGIRAQNAGSSATNGDDDEDAIASLAILNISQPSLIVGGFGIEDDPYDNGEGSSSSMLALRRAKPSSTTECVACRDRKPVFQCVRVPCMDRYCRACLEALFNAAMEDESLFPPRCCRQEIPLSSLQDRLSTSFVERFAQKSLEYNTPNRTYCAVPTCSAFIPPASIEGDRALCQKCGNMTCTICKAFAHAGDCPEDPEVQMLAEVGRQAGWQRCYQCQRMVELTHGCNHITCLCKAQFCYACGVQWKQCMCAQWDEDRLYTRAEQLVARDHPNNRANLARRVEQAVNHLRDRHDCEHRKWRYVQGPHQCEECFCNLPQYIFQCHQCQLQACNRCRRNRL